MNRENQKKLFFLNFLLILLLFSACEKETLFVAEPKEELTIYLHLSKNGVVYPSTYSELAVSADDKSEDISYFKSDGNLVNPRTYALTETQEEVVDDVDVFVFEEDPLGGPDKFRYHVSGKQVQQTGLTCKFTVVLRRSESVERFRLVVVCNARTEIQAAKSSFVVGDTSDAFFAKINFQTSSKWNSMPGTTNYRPIPMWGRSPYSIPIVASGSGGSFGNIKMERVLARVDVYIDGLNPHDSYSSGSLPSPIGGIVDFRELRVCNLQSHLLLVPKAASLNSLDGSTIKASIPAHSSSNQNFIYLRDEQSSRNAYKHVIYLPESDNTTASLTTSDFGCLLVNVATEYWSDWRDSWYRIDFWDRSAPAHNYWNHRLDILRNRSYDVVIKDILGPGAETPEEALAIMPDHSKILAHIVPWNTEYLTIDDVNPTFFLKVSKGQYVFPSLGNFGLSPDMKQLIIETNYFISNSDRGWTAALQPSGATWIRFSPTPLQANEGVSTKLTVEVDPYVGGAADRQAELHIKAGNFTKVVRFIQKFN